MVPPCPLERPKSPGRLRAQARGGASRDANVSAGPGALRVRADRGPVTQGRVQHPTSSLEEGGVVPDGRGRGGPRPGHGPQLAAGDAPAPDDDEVLPGLGDHPGALAERRDDVDVGHPPRSGGPTARGANRADGADVYARRQGGNVLGIRFAALLRVMGNGARRGAPGRRRDRHEPRDPAHPASTEPGVDRQEQVGCHLRGRGAHPAASTEPGVDRQEQVPPGSPIDPPRVGFNGARRRPPGTGVFPCHEVSRPDPLLQRSPA